MSRTNHKRKSKACKITPAQLAARQRNKSAYGTKTPAAPSFQDREEAATVAFLSFDLQESIVHARLSEFGINTGSQLSELVSKIDIPVGVDPAHYVCQNSIEATSDIHVISAQLLGIAYGVSAGDQNVFDFPAFAWAKFAAVTREMITDGTIVSVPLAEGRVYYLLPVELDTWHKRGVWARKLRQRFPKIQVHTIHR